MAIDTREIIDDVEGYSILLNKFTGKFEVEGGFRNILDRFDTYNDAKLFCIKISKGEKFIIASSPSSPIMYAACLIRINKRGDLVLSNGTTVSEYDLIKYTEERERKFREHLKKFDSWLQEFWDMKNKFKEEDNLKKGV